MVRYKKELAKAQVKKFHKELQNQEIATFSRVRDKPKIEKQICRKDQRCHFQKQILESATMIATKAR